MFDVIIFNILHMAFTCDVDAFIKTKPDCKFISASNGSMLIWLDYLYTTVYLVLLGCK